MDESDWPGPAEWLRLKALDKNCDIGMERAFHGSGNRRQWCVTIHHRYGKHGDTVRGVKPQIRAALLQALNEAEERGWHLPRKS